MRIATFNVNSIKARLPFVLHWLAAREPDIACLQELKVPDDKFPHEALKDAGYHAYVHGQQRWNGVAVLSRKKGGVVQRGLPGAERAGARLITVDIDGLSVTSVYVPNGKSVDHPDFQSKLAWLDALGSYLLHAVDGEERAVVGGDFNVTPSDADSYDPDGLRDRIFHTDEERQRIARLMEAGLMDMYRQANPDGSMFSWWDYRAGSFHKNKGLRIDLLLATSALMNQATDVWIDRDYRKKKEGETASDHAPVIADLRSK